MVGKKAQITIFILIGLVVIIIISIIAYIYYSNNAINNNFDKIDSTSKDRIFYFVKDCMQDSLINGIITFGMPKNGDGALSDSILTNTLICVDELKLFQEEGYDLELNMVDINLDIGSAKETIIYILTYNGILKKNNIKIDLDTFELNFPKSTFSLDFDEGIATSEIFLESADRRTKLIIPKGTIVTQNDGLPATYVSLSMVDRRDKRMKNSLILGNLVYQASPDGANLQAPEGKIVEMIFQYEEKDLQNLIPNGQTEEDLECGYLSKSGAYIPWPSEIDTEKNRLTCEINHFSIDSIAVGCGYDATTSETKKTKVRAYNQPCVIYDDNLCEVEFFTCENALGCNPDYRNLETNAVYMTSYDERVQQSIIGYTKEYTFCELRDWTYKDIEKNECKCYIGDPVNNVECEEYETGLCYDKCKVDALSSEEINNGPINDLVGGDGIADDINFENTEKKGCECILDTSNQISCEVTPAPLSWGWEDISGEWDLETEKASGNEIVVDGLGEYEFKIAGSGSGSSCFDPNSFKITATATDLIALDINNNIFESLDGKVVIVEYTDENVQPILNGFLGISSYDPYSEPTVLTVAPKLILTGIQNNEEKFQCAYVDLEVEVIGSGIELLTTPRDGVCAVSILDRLRFECGCPNPDKEGHYFDKCEQVQNCISAIDSFKDSYLHLGTNLCYDDIPGGCENTIDSFKDSYLHLGTNLCYDGIPKECENIIGDNKNGGFCDGNNKAHCVTNLDLTNENNCICGELNHVKGTKELCCGINLVKDSDLPPGSELSCSAITGIKNTCIHSGIGLECFPQCPAGYDRVTGTQFGSPATRVTCPVYDPLTGRVNDYMECCQKKQDNCLIKTGNSLSCVSASGPFSCEKQGGSYFDTAYECYENTGDSSDFDACDNKNLHDLCSSDSGLDGHCSFTGGNSRLRCIGSLPDGSACTSDTECSPGTCINNECESNLCNGQLRKCSDDNYQILSCNNGELEQLQNCKIDESCALCYCDSHFLQCRDYLGDFVELPDGTNPFLAISSKINDPLIAAGLQSDFVNVKEECMVECMEYNGYHTAGENKCSFECTNYITDFIIKNELEDEGGCEVYYSLHTTMNKDQINGQCVADRLKLMSLVLGIAGGNAFFSATSQSTATTLSTANSAYKKVKLVYDITECGISALSGDYSDCAKVALRKMASSMIPGTGDKFSDYGVTQMTRKGLIDPVSGMLGASISTFVMAQTIENKIQILITLENGERIIIEQ